MYLSFQFPTPKKWNRQYLKPIASKALCEKGTKITKAFYLNNRSKADESYDPEDEFHFDFQTYLSAWRFLVSSDNVIYWMPYP